MSSTGNTTVPASTDDFSPLVPASRPLWALVLAWSVDEPHRIGEIAFLEDERGSSCILGRDVAPPDDLAMRACFLRQRPGTSLAGGPLVGERLSRRQLLLRVTPVGVEATNIGTSVVLVDGHPIKPDVPVLLKPGAVIMVRGHSVYLLVQRPRELPTRPGAPGDLHAFGELDADNLAGESPAAWALRAEIDAAVLTGGHVLLRGATGTGKELVARAVHRKSGRRGKFVAYNAATLTPSLADSILFGNAPNYPNPGTPERPGLLGEAQGGTFFFDEIGELPVDTQAHLLRAAEGEYTRLGESTPRRCDMLLVAATNRDLSVVKHDLLRRFSFVVELPALGARLEDVPLLARALVLHEHRRNPALTAPFVRAGARGGVEVQLASALVLAMLRASYEGNVRDLRNLLLRGMAETRTPPMMPPADLRPWHASPTLPPPARDDAEGEADTEDLMDGFGPSRERVLEMLLKHGWHLERTAKALGLSRHQLQRRMTKYGIKRP